MRRRHTDGQAEVMSLIRGWAAGGAPALGTNYLCCSCNWKHYVGKRCEPAR